MTIGRSLFFAVSFLAGALPFGVAAQGQPSVSRYIFESADLNHDGFVDLEEYQKDVVRAFRALDFNGNGYIEVDEVMSIPDKTRAKLIVEKMMKVDRDGDGKLSFTEVVEARMAFFDLADTDKDERLSMSEAIDYDVQAARKAALQAAAGAPKKQK